MNDTYLKYWDSVISHDLQHKDRLICYITYGELVSVATFGLLKHDKDLAWFGVRNTKADLLAEVSISIDTLKLDPKNHTHYAYTKLLEQCDCGDCTIKRTKLGRLVYE